MGTARVWKSSILFRGLGWNIFVQIPKPWCEAPRGVGVKHLICSQLLKWKEWLYLGSVSVSSCISLCFLIHTISSLPFVSLSPTCPSSLIWKTLYSLSTFFICKLWSTTTLGYLLMDDLYKAVAPFYPSSSGSGGGGFNSPPGPSENSWIVNSSSAEELRRDQEVGEPRVIPTTPF